MHTKENNPNKLHPQMFLAHVGQYQTWASYLNSYEEAVELLFQKVANTQTSPDLLASSLLFLMRHTLELGYKFALADLHGHNKTFFNPGKHVHSLASLHKELQEQFKETTVALNLPEEVVDSFNQNYQQTEIAMRTFDQVDANGFAFRYPTNRKGDQNSLATEEKINLLEVKEQFDTAMILLNYTADVLAPYSEYQNEQSWYCP